MCTSSETLLNMFIFWEPMHLMYLIGTKGSLGQRGLPGDEGPTGDRGATGPQGPALDARKITFFRCQ